MIKGNRSKTFYVDKTICGNYFKVTIIGTVNPVSLLTKRDLQRIFGKKQAVIRDKTHDQPAIGGLQQKAIGSYGLPFCALRSRRSDSFEGESTSGT